MLEGPAGVGVVNERNEGWDSVMDDQRQFVKVGAQTANWSAEEGKSVMETVLKANDNDIQLVFAQNDEMGLGAALAVEEAGLVPGKDVKIATIDGTKGAMEALAAGRLSFVAEYNPLFGDTAVDVVEQGARRRVRSSRTSSSRATCSTRPRPRRRRCPPASSDRRIYGARSMDSDPGTGQPHQVRKPVGPASRRVDPSHWVHSLCLRSRSLWQTVLATREAPT